MAINLAERMVPIMDAVYKKEALTAPFEVNPDNIKFDGTKTVKLFDMDILQGLGEYSRQNGYVMGEVGNTWNPYTLTQDRGRKFIVDAMDNEETMGLLFGKLVSEFMRRKVIPEVDAYRFSSVAGASGATVVSADIGTSTKPFDLLDEAEEVMGDEEVPAEGKILYVSEKFYRSIKNNITRTLSNDTGVSRVVEIYNGMEVRRVPKSRFCTGITMQNGKDSGQENGGYKFTKSVSKPINFMIVYTPALVTVTKHVVPRIFDPNTLQSHNAWSFDYRLYHDILARKNMEKGIYVHTGATAITADING